MIACTSVGTLVYARTATREGEIAVRSALGAGRARIIGQLFVEALVLASVAAAVGLMAADRALAWGIESVNRASGGAPFWMTPGLKLSTILYAGGLAVVSAVMLSLLPALKVTRSARAIAPREPGHRRRHAALRARLDGRDDRAGGADGHGHPWRHGEREPGDAQAEHPRRISKSRVSRRSHRCGPAVRGGDDGGVRGAAGADVRGARATHRAGTRRCRGHLRRPRAGGTGRERGSQRSSPRPAPGRRTKIGFGRRRWARDSSRPSIVRSSPGVHSTRATGVPAARTVIVNEAFARAFSRDAGRGSPIGARLRYAASSRDDRAAADASADTWFEIVGVVRDFGLDPDDEGNEQPYRVSRGVAGNRCLRS